MAQKHVPALDGLRAVAASLVFATHTLYGHMTGGALGVDIFFVLSGYLITGILVRPGSSLVEFYIRRAKRLWPALFVAILLARLIWNTWCPNFSFASAALSAALYYSNFVAMRDSDSLGLLSATWSLANEEQFYLTWPAALSVIRIRPERAWLWTLALAVGFAVFRAVAAPSYFSPLAHLDGILLGSALALAPAMPRARVVSWAFVAALPVFALRANPHTASYGTFFEPLVAIGTAALICECVVETSVVARALSFKPLCWLGQRSYGFYLFHVIVIRGLSPFRRPHDGVNFVGIGLLALVISLLISDLSYRFVEMPIRTGSLFRRPVEASR